MAETIEEMQRRICRAYGAKYFPPLLGSKVGIALQTMDFSPIHAVRLLPTETTCGWYIYAGDEWSEDPNYYQPLCVEHMEKHCPVALPFLALPPGWRFLTDGKGKLDAWFAEELLKDPG